MKVRVTQLDDTTRRRFIASSDGVLIFGERLKSIGSHTAWIMTGCHLVPAHEVLLCAQDIQEAFRLAS